MNASFDVCVVPCTEDDLLHLHLSYAFVIVVYSIIIICCVCQDCKFTQTTSRNLSLPIRHNSAQQLPSQQNASQINRQQQFVHWRRSLPPTYDEAVRYGTDLPPSV